MANRVLQYGSPHFGLYKSLPSVRCHQRAMSDALWLRVNSVGDIGGCGVTCLLSPSNQLHLMLPSRRFYIPWSYDQCVGGMASIM
jgi:hypothetical protein